jgi:hypothetical protein
VRVRVIIGELASKPPLTEQEALAVAFLVLRGYIVNATPYRNLRTKHKFIAVLRSASKADTDASVHVLEEFAGAYREIFASEHLLRVGSGADRFWVEDLDME